MVKYCTNVDNVVETLDRYGVAVIPDILNLDECKYFDDESWITIENITNNNVLRRDTNTWRNFYDYLFPLHSMLVQHYIGHSQYIWDVRQHPKIIEPFSKI